MTRDEVIEIMGRRECQILVFACGPEPTGYAWDEGDLQAVVWVSLSDYRVVGKEPNRTFGWFERFRDRLGW
jgi:hypothetical protein